MGIGPWPSWAVHGIGAWWFMGALYMGAGLDYLDGGVVGLVRLDLGVRVRFWMRYGDVINMEPLHPQFHCKGMAFIVPILANNT